MFHATIDHERQTFVIEDRDGNLIATRNWPIQRQPARPIKSDPENMKAWHRICDLVEAANAGLKFLNPDTIRQEAQS